MKNKVLLIILSIFLALVMFILVLSAFDNNPLNFFNVVKYETVTNDGYEVSFHGSFGQIRKIKIKKDGKTVSKHKMGISSTILGKAEEPIVFEDVNGDTVPDLFIISAIDKDGDIHRRLLLSDKEEFKTCDATFTNFVYDKETNMLTSEQCEKILTSSDVPEEEAPYELRTERCVYTVSGTFLIKQSERSVIYYSETEIYCYSSSKYNPATGELLFNDDDWMTPAEYRSERDKLAKNFTLPIPE